MVLTGTTVGDGVQARDSDRVMVQVQDGLQMGLARVSDMGLVQGPGPGPGLVLDLGMGQEVVELMEADMDPGLVQVVKEVVVAAEVAGQLDMETDHHHQSPRTGTKTGKKNQFWC
ncbi:hypothetical protein LOK49_LG07G00657 [Camellia lanceoleosa]|uniref:Uncharacterized protein n=1 Tax=Camellia lanceoleosa TaxID=1840588 RepID=A0ACC0H413_9ERIC|nr:hypothetical protein LOK49_LG07G00657 [Camellia lanceoleosa]